MGGSRDGRHCAVSKVRVAADLNFGKVPTCTHMHPPAEVGGCDDGRVGEIVEMGVSRGVCRVGGVGRGVNVGGLTVVVKRQS